MKKVFDKLKAFIDVWKIWLFLAALIGTNGAQMFANSESAKVGPPIEIVKPIAEPQKTTIIYKFDKKYCDELVESHINSNRH